MGRQKLHALHRMLGHSADGNLEAMRRWFVERPDLAEWIGKPLPIDGASTAPSAPPRL